MFCCGVRKTLYGIRAADNVSISIFVAPYEESIFLLFRHPFFFISSSSIHPLMHYLELQQYITIPLVMLSRSMPAEHCILTFGTFAAFITRRICIHQENAIHTGLLLPVTNQHIILKHLTTVRMHIIQKATPLCICQGS